MKCFILLAACVAVAAAAIGGSLTDFLGSKACLNCCGSSPCCSTCGIDPGESSAGSAALHSRSFLVKWEDKVKTAREGAVLTLFVHGSRLKRDSLKDLLLGRPITFCPECCGPPPCCSCCGLPGCSILG